jgi:hypothetical protein
MHAKRDQAACEPDTHECLDDEHEFDGRLGREDGYANFDKIRLVSLTQEIGRISLTNGLALGCRIHISARDARVQPWF